MSSIFCGNNRYAEEIDSGISKQSTAAPENGAAVVRFRERRKRVADFARFCKGKTRLLLEEKLAKAIRQNRFCLMWCRMRLHPLYQPLLCGAPLLEENANLIRHGIRRATFPKGEGYAGDS